MRIKYHVVLVTSLLLFAACQAMAVGTPQEAAAPPSHILPVFVHVDQTGEITSVEPADRLEPALDELLRRTLEQIITKPAHDAQGKAVASQFIVILSLHTTPTAGGKYAAKFTYVSASTVPTGRWHWVHYGDKVALARQDVIRHDLTRQTTHCVDGNLAGSGHRKIYISSRGVVMGREPDVLVGKC